MEEEKEFKQPLPKKEVGLESMFQKLEITVVGQKAGEQNEEN